jgi:uncharacterized membrane protein YbhN (UPF0104 family)
MDMVGARATPATPGRDPRRSAPWLRRASRALPVVAAVSSLGGLVLLMNPRSVMADVAGMDTRVLPAVAGLVAAFYLLQGLRWHLLLRSIGARSRLLDTQLTNLASQAVGSVLPLGDLTRAVLLSRSSGTPVGRVAATVTVQELSFVLLLVVGAAPGIARLPGGPVWMTCVIAGIAGISAILLVPRLFRTVRRPLATVPVIRRFVGEIDALQRDVRGLLLRPSAAAGVILDLARVVVATAALLLLLRGFHVAALGWWDVAMVLAISFVGGALSFLPGGVGANEASVVGILAVLGVAPATAAAAALLFRLALTLVAVTGGGAGYGLLRRRQADAAAPRSVRSRLRLVPTETAA